MIYKKDNVKQLIRVHVPSMCFTDKLGEEFELVATPELEQAILTINSACSKRAYDQANYVFTEFLVDARDKLVAAFKRGDQKEFMEILLLIANYKRENKLELMGG